MAKKQKEKPDHRLSENSKKSSSDFKTTNQIASLIYQLFKQIMPRCANRAQYQKLHRLVIKITQSGPTEFLGERKLYQGNITWLKGFKLNPYTQWDSLLVSVQPTVSISTTENVVSIRLPEIHHENLSLPQRTTKFSLQFICCQLDVDRMEISSFYSKPLELPYPLEQSLPPKKTKIQVPEMDGKILLVLITLNTYFRRTANQEWIEKNNYLSSDRKYYAGEVLDTFYIKDGQVMFYPTTPQSLRKMNSSQVINDQGTPWEDD